MFKTTDNQNELFVVVDRDDTIVGYRTRYECHHDKTLIHRVTNIAIFNRNNKILFQKRSMTKDLYPGMYTLSASGHVGKDETYEEAAKRELVEEVGVSGLPIDFVARQVVAAASETEMLALYKATYEGPYSFNKEEVEELVYMDKGDVVKVKSLLTPCALAALQIFKWL